MPDYKKFGVHPRVCCPDNNTSPQDCPATDPLCGSEEDLEDYEYSGDDYEFSGEEDGDFYDYISTPTVLLSSLICVLTSSSSSPMTTVLGTRMCST